NRICTGSSIPQNNICVISFDQMVSSAKKPELFFGQPYRQGDAPDPGPGNLENVPHGTIQLWTSDPSGWRLWILGNLIGADTFALPFWNWDSRSPGRQAGMTLPAIYTNTSSPLYDDRRNPVHQLHGTIHLWTGDPRQPNGEDMSNFSL
ncbi:hypothetical protein EJB05_39707, partial [Eragrostis curvula]